MGPTGPLGCGKASAYRVLVPAVGAAVPGSALAGVGGRAAPFIQAAVSTHRGRTLRARPARSAHAHIGLPALSMASTRPFALRLAVAHRGATRGPDIPLHAGALLRPRTQPVSRAIPLLGGLTHGGGAAPPSPPVVAAAALGGRTPAMPGACPCGCAESSTHCVAACVSSPPLGALARVGGRAFAPIATRSLAHRLIAQGPCVAWHARTRPRGGAITMPAARPATCAQALA